MLMKLFGLDVVVIENIYLVLCWNYCLIFVVKIVLDIVVMCMKISCKIVDDFGSYGCDGICVVMNNCVLLKLNSLIWM